MTGKKYPEPVRYGGSRDSRKAPKEVRPVTVRDEDFEPAEIKFVHKDGYGFVRRENKADAYFHVERLDPEVVAVIKEDTPVDVAIGDGRKGPHVLAMRLA